MTNQTSTSLLATTAGLGDDSGLLLIRRFASEIKNRWRNGERPDVAGVLAEHPKLKRYKSVVLDLAHDEYLHRLEQGELLDADEFSRRFPTLRKSLYLLIEVQKLLDQDSDFQALQEMASWPEPGESFLGFRLIAELGRGAFGRVFLACEPSLGNRLVALKVAPQGGQEAEMLGKLRHPNIVPVYSVQEDEATGLTAVCMPYLGRATLCDVLDQEFANSRPPTHSRVILDVIQDLSDDPELLESSSFDRILRKGSYVDGILHLAVQLADALAYAHSRGICHRDLKPSNVLMSLDGRPLLLDFNLSFDEQVNTNRIGGTLPYMAPEQLRSVVLDRPDPQGHADPRTDLFSLGVILYELLSGSLPFGAILWGGSVEQIAEHLLQEQDKGPRPIRDKNKRVNKQLAQLIDDCLAFNPERRPESASALAAAFRKQLSPVRRGKRWVRNHRRRVTVFASLLLALILLGVGFLALRDPYSVRQFRRGLEYSGQGKYELAVDCFNASIRAKPDDSQALFARGKAHQKLGDFRLAFEDFQAAFRVAPSPKISACMGHCLNKLQYHEEAIECYCIAMDMGYDSPVLLNNMGHSYLQLGRLEDAEGYLREAIEADAELQAAHHNLVLVFLRRGLAEEPIPDSALVHAKKALKVGPPSADLYLDVGALYAFAAKEDPNLVRPALEYLDRSVAYGLDPTLLQSRRALASLREQEGFKKLLTKPPRTEPPPIKSVLLVDPS